jgi:hemerythrin
MASLMWSYSCTAGIQAIDDQHGILMDALNELRLALLHGAECQMVRTMLMRVAELMRLHVQSEESLLERHGFPELAAYRAERQRLMGRLAQFDVRYEQRQSGAAFELVEYLRRWFTSHTGAGRQSYGPWLVECGVR